MSVCPHCQIESDKPEFCSSCFRSLETRTPGRFASLLEQGFAERGVESLEAGGTDLTSVTYRPGRWRPALKFPGVGWLAPVCAVTLLGLAVWSFYVHRQHSQAVRHRQNAQALLTQGDYQGAQNQLNLAPDEPETHRLRAELAACQGQWEQAAAEFRLISVSDSEVNRHLDEAARTRAQAFIQEARHQKDCVRALGLSDQAEQLLRLHQGSNAEMAQLHFLRAQLFRKLDLTAEAIEELRLVLKLDPGAREALELRAQLLPRPQPTVARYIPSKAPAAAPPSVDFPRLQMDPGYPTYQRPDPESTSDSDDEEGEKERKGRRRRRKDPRFSDR